MPNRILIQALESGHSGWLPRRYYGAWWADKHERTGGLQIGYGGLGRVCSHAEAIKSTVEYKNVPKSI